MGRLARKFAWLFIIGTALSVMSCAASSPTTPAQIPTALEGVVQKGPFSRGSSILVQFLNEDFSLSGESYTVETEDNLGNFSVNAPKSRYVKIKGTGYYYNETTNAISDSQLILNSFANISVMLPTDTATTKINILTALSYYRIQYLMSTLNMTYSDAEAQAQDEILKAFWINDTVTTNFDQMDISVDGDTNAMLLAISLQLLGDNAAGQLTTLINGVSYDIEQDGTIDTQEYLDEICSNARALNLVQIRTNLETYYTGSTIPAFEKFVDSNCNGIINRDDTDTYIWLYAGDTSATLPFDNGSGAVIDYVGAATSSTIYLFSEYYGYLVYASTDGVTWTLKTDTPGWKAREERIVNAVSIGDTLYVYTSYNSGLISPITYYRVIWKSTDGVNWTQTYQHAMTEETEYEVILGIGAHNGLLWRFMTPEVESTILSSYYSSDGGVTWTLAGTTDTGYAFGFGGRFLSIGDKIWTFVSDSGTRALTTTDGITWTASNIYNPDGDSEFNYAVFEDKLWYIGGSSDFVGPYEMIYTADANTWTEFVAYPFWSPIYETTMVTFQDKIWLMQGHHNALHEAFDEDYNTSTWYFGKYQP